jgi:hypothetical protein
LFAVPEGVATTTIGIDFVLFVTVIFNVNVRLTGAGGFLTSQVTVPEVVLFVAALYIPFGADTYFAKG